MMAHVTRAEFFLKAERKALGFKKPGLELPLRKKCSVTGGTRGRAQSGESLVSLFNSLMWGGDTVVGISELSQQVKALAD